MHLGAAAPMRWWAPTATGIALVLAGLAQAGALAWPGLLPEAWGPGLAVAYVALLPLLHWGLQRMPVAQAIQPVARPVRLPVVEMALAQPVEAAPRRDQSVNSIDSGQNPGCNATGGP